MPRLPRLPSPCLLCQRWQHQPLCDTCLRRWRPEVHRCGRCASPWRPALPHLACPHCEDPCPEFDRAIAALDYVPPWRHLITRFKFGQWPALGPVLAGLLGEAVQARQAAAATQPMNAGMAVDLVLPVPVSAERLRERGYNQAGVLARHTARALHLPMRDNLLVRPGQAARLATLDATERRLAIRGSFALTAEGTQAVRGRHIALVDDVLTTGATLDELSRLLRQAGARGVSAWVLARTPPPGWR
ncbi:MAG: ComF family protein [Proteobacteria bacterium]|uniref:ComF family protein n=1 Tax=Aquabacterium sp. TaxID=1872578 RepID=UPI0035C7179E|nr:ComF family protein [Pseudomonadota bacterium]